MNKVRVLTSAPTISGTVAAGAIELGFRVSSDGAATVLDIPITDGASLNLNAIALGAVYPAITYTISSGTLYIVEVRE
jgi:hypothetical protein